MLQHQSPGTNRQSMNRRACIARRLLHRAPRGADPSARFDQHWFRSVYFDRVAIQTGAVLTPYQSFKPKAKPKKRLKRRNVCASN